MKSNSLKHPLPTSLLGLGLALLTGCQSYNQQIAELVTDYETGEFSRAAETISSGDLDDALDSKTDGLLFLLEAGKILQDAGRFDESSVMFDRASARMEHFDLQADISVSEEFFSAVGTQASRDYRGTDYDRILLEVYETLNYLALHDFGEAMVHVRRAYRRQAEAVARNADEIGRREKDGNANARKALQSRAYQEYEKSLESLATDAYSDFVNPMASFLSAVLLREEGSNSNALVELRKLIGIQPDNSYLRPLLEEFEAGARPVPDRFYIIFENGLAPSREEWSLTLPTPNGISRVAVPTLRLHEKSARGLHVEALDGSLELETERIADLDSIIVTDFKVHLPGLIWRTIIAQVAKETTTHALAKQDDSGVIRALSNVFKVITASADLRTWRTPGSEFQIAYGQAPVDGQLSLQLISTSGSQSGSTVVVLPRARTHFIYVRTPRLSKLQPHVFHLGLAPSN